MDFLTIAFSAFIGAAVALLAERLARRHDAKLEEEAALNNLILDLAAKRVFKTAADHDWQDGEMQRVVESIDHVRRLAREARLALRPRSRALPPLRQITLSCNNFLERSERENDATMKRALDDLTAEISAQVALLHLLNTRRISSDPPGSFALTA